MADKLDWLGKHLVLLRRLSLEEAAAAEGYKIPPELEDLFEGVTGAADMVFKLAGLGKYKSACELLAYIAHRRAAVWWGYRCVCSVDEELRQKPPEEIIDIEKPLEAPPVPGYFNFETPKPDPALTASMEAAVAAARGEAAQASSLVNPVMKNYVARGVEQAFRSFEAANGVHPMELLKRLGERMKQDPYAIDPDSPIFRMEKELKEKMEAQRKEIIGEVKSQHAAAGLASPLNKIPKLKAHKEKLRGNALDAVYRWVAVPDAENSRKCLDAGNECSDTPAGLLALSSFWAFGNLAPDGDLVIATPPGLAANGLDKAILLCAVQQGGTRKIAERYEEYFRLGVEVISGADNWETSLASGTPPHQEAGKIPPEGKEEAGEEPNGYRRWSGPAGEESGGGAYRRWRAGDKIPD
jgi:hypothetical protein